MEASPTSEDFLTAILDYTEQTTSAVASQPDHSFSTSLAFVPVNQAHGHKAQLRVKLNESLWKPISCSSKCANAKCRKHFTSVIQRRRNCSMCGEVFCRECANYRRKLSASAKPDPLGTYFNVCKLCYYFESEDGMSRNLLKEFSDHRREIVGLKQAAISCNLRNPLCGQAKSPLKSLVLERELQKLIVGYKQNTGLIQGILAEIKVPAWQKLSQWVDSSNASGCFDCKRTFGVFTKKINCRVGGQVFCSECCKDEIVLYYEGEDIKWAINGKPGAPSVTPTIYKLLPICCRCMQDVQDITQKKVLISAISSSASTYLKEIHPMHHNLSKLQSTIETILPQYMTVVDALDMTDDSPKSISGRNPLQNLVKIQIDLSDAFSSLAVQSQNLKHLNPKGITDKKLHRNVMIGVYRFYSENMYQFRLTKHRLSELMPTDHLKEIQLDVSQRSMERVHVYLQQLMFELLDLKQYYAFSETFFEPIMNTIRCIERDLKPFLEDRNENWEKHAQCSVDFVRGELEAGRRTLALNNSFLNKHFVIGQISSRLHECYRELQAKTIDQEFLATKQSIRNAVVMLDGFLAQ